MGWTLDGGAESSRLVVRDAPPQLICMDPDSTWTGLVLRSVRLGTFTVLWPCSKELELTLGASLCLLPPASPRASSQQPAFSS